MQGGKHTKATPVPLFYDTGGDGQNLPAPPLGMDNPDIWTLCPHPWSCNTADTLLKKSLLGEEVMGVSPNDSHHAVASHTLCPEAPHFLLLVP